MKILNKIREYIWNLNYFPTLNLNFLKSDLMAYLKHGGVVLLIAILLYSTNIIPFMWFKFWLNIENRNIKNIQYNIEYQENKLKEKIQNKNCMVNQLQRLVENKEVKISYCK